MSVTGLGMPAMPPRTGLPTWKQAWDSALYGEQGFFRRNAPADHFRTSVHASPLFAAALLRLVRDAGLDTIVDVGAGRGELLTELHRLDPDLTLLGVEVAPRPESLHQDIAWSPVLPSEVDGLLVANEWLDNVPCQVVEVDDTGQVRLVHVEPDGTESLGSSLTDPGVPASLAQWCDQWWPLTLPGTRAEIGTTRDRAWADVVSRLTRGLAIAIDYGHVLEDRPAYGSLRSYRGGRQVPVAPDGSRDVTAHVAVDALAAAVGGEARRQRDALRELGLVASRPPEAADAADFLAALSRAGQAAELMALDGLGDFYWVVARA